MKNRTKRLTYIITLLAKGLHVNTLNISKELGVSQKTIQTDFNKYLLPYFKNSIYYDYSNKYYKTKQQLLSSTLFNQQELAIICILKAKSQDKYCDNDFSLYVDAFINKFEKLLSHEIYEVSSIEEINEFKKEVILINHAINNNQEIECTYRDKKRLLHPLKILNFDDYWYLINYDTHYKDIRKYHLNSIKNIKILDSCFEPDTHSIKKFDNAINAWFKPEIEPYIVLLNIQKRVAPYFIRKPISNTQRIIKKYEDGSIDIEISITDDMEIIPTIQRYLPFIQIISPKFLEDKIKNKIMKIFY